jgi:hypothetical protein
MTAERARAILKRHGYVVGGQVMGGISNEVEDRQDPDPQIGKRNAGRDPIVVPPGETADENERDDRHLPSDFKQRRALRGSGNQLLPEEPSLKRGGRTR